MMILKDIEIQVRNLNFDAMLPRAKRFVADTIEKYVPVIDSRMLRRDARKMIEQVRSKHPKEIFMLFPPKLAIAVSAAIEHFHTVKARKLLFSDNIGIVWASLEQIEHKHIAFCIMKETGAGYFFRLLGLLLALGFIETDILSFFQALIEYLKPGFHPDKYEERDYQKALERFERLIQYA